MAGMPHNLAGNAGPVPPRGYLPIEEHGIVGDLRTVALVAGETDELFIRTDFWQDWFCQSRYPGRWREMVQRSALALKLLVYHPTGALVAAPTTSPARAARRRTQLGLPLRWLRDARSPSTR